MAEWMRGVVLKGGATDVQPFNGAGPCGPEMGCACRYNLITLMLQRGPVFWLDALFWPEDQIKREFEYWQVPKFMLFY